MVLNKTYKMELCTLIFEKIPEKLLALYYRRIKKNREPESLKKLRDLIAEEAEYRVQASEKLNRIGSDKKMREYGALEAR